MTTSSRKKKRTPQYRILVTGDRNWQNQEVVDQVLDEYSRRFKNKRMKIIEGGAKGADAAAAAWAQKRNAIHTQVKANWALHHRAAGPIRNKAMLGFKPHAVVAFHDDLQSSKGTKNMLSQALKSQIPKEVHHFTSRGERFSLRELGERSKR